MSTALAIAEPTAIQPGQLNREQIELLKTTICKGATDSELQLFVQVCRSKGLDPFSRQIHAVKRWNPNTQREEMAIQIAIDGFRLQAERSGKYQGQEGPYWCDAKGQWTDVWLYSDFPVAAKVGVYREGFAAPMYAVAMMSEYIQTKKDGTPNSMWQKMPAGQLAKCAESLALRKAFPAELSGFYTPDEMGQADNEPSQPQRQRQQAQPAQQAAIVERAAEPQPSDFKGMIAAFATIREKIGDGLYYKILKAHGVEHSNEFKGRDGARSCFKEMKKVEERLAEEAQAKADAQAFVDDVNPETAA